jgi:predicted O-methyltransferase YrrM
VDGTKAEYREYMELAEPKLSPKALLVIDNLLMSGEVALPEHAPDTFWSQENRRAARELNADLVNNEKWVGSVLPVGDGIGFAARR